MGLLCSEAHCARVLHQEHEPDGRKLKIVLPKTETETEAGTETETEAEKQLLDETERKNAVVVVQSPLRPCGWEAGCPAGCHTAQAIHSHRDSPAPAHPHWAGVVQVLVACIIDVVLLLSDAMKFDMTTVVSGGGIADKCKLY